MGFGVLCRSLVQSRAFHLPIPLASTPPKERRCECQLTRAAPSTHPLRRAKLVTQNTFDWFDPDFSARSSRASFRQFMLSASRPGHPFRGPQLPALPRLPGRRNQLPLTPSPSGRNPEELSLGEDASSQSLQLTCCHGNPLNASTLELRACACPTSPFHPELPTSTNVEAGHPVPSGAALVRRKRHPQPRAVTR